MTGRVEQRLNELGLTIKEPAKPVAKYVPYVVTGSLVFISGQVPTDAGGIAFKGKLGDAYSVDEGQAAARIAAINVLAALKAACGGDLDRVRKVVRLCGYVNAVPAFGEHPAVVNGASNLMVEVFGEEIGLHSRAAVGVGSLPFDVAVEVDGVFEIG